MKTIKEVKEILKKNDFNWCITEIENTLKSIADLPDEMTLEEALKRITISSKLAFYWALNVGDQDLMIDYVKEPRYAFCWAEHIGDSIVMKDRIKGIVWARKWNAIFRNNRIADIEKMRTIEEVRETLTKKCLEWCKPWAERGLKLVADLPNEMTLEEALKTLKASSELAFYWGLIVEEDRRLMIDYITDSEWAFFWAITIGDKDVMIDRITDPMWITFWSTELGYIGVMREKIAGTNWAYRWNLIFSDNVREE